jgi:hypothetical protein
MFNCANALIHRILFEARIVSEIALLQTVSCSIRARYHYSNIISPSFSLTVTSPPWPQKRRKGKQK